MTPDLATALLGGIAAIIGALTIGFARILKEFKKNSGSTMRDRIDRIEERVDEVYRILAGK